MNSKMPKTPAPKPQQSAGTRAGVAVHKTLSNAVGNVKDFFKAAVKGAPQH